MTMQAAHRAGSGTAGQGSDHRAPDLPAADLAAEAARIYGIDGPTALSLHAAYLALRRRDGATATRHAAEVARSHPDCHHAWVLLGLVALDRHEGDKAERFLTEAARFAPKDPQVLAGLGKARVLLADPFGAIGLFTDALQHGSTDRPMIRLYKDLMAEMHRLPEAAATLEAVAQRMQDGALYHMLAEVYLAIEDFPAAIAAYDAEFTLDPGSADARIGQVKAALYRHDFARAETLTAELGAESPDMDELHSLRMTALRNLGRNAEALAMLDAQYQSPLYYKRALGVAAHVHLDLGDRRAAGHAFRAADALTDAEAMWSGRAYGTFLLAEGRHAEAVAFYARRQPEENRAKIPYGASSPEALATTGQLFVMQEQGIGDQFALLPLIARAPVAPGARVTFVGDPRMGPALAGNRLGLDFLPEDAFAPEVRARGTTLFVGDLVRYLPAEAPAPPLGGYLSVDAARVARLRRSYLDRALGAPVVGLAWRSGDRLTGWHRSLPLPELTARLPRGALVVNLQYGDCAEEIAAATALRPDLTFLQDGAIDQMADLAGFLTQIAALDRIVTIDNTTAHAAGALGHRDTHVLLPAGAECMWYWGRTGARDPWYGNLTLHRQARPRDWSAPLAAVGALFGGMA
ncbi:tetratricopeptide repeat protein [Acidimangrovimonas sediminis]|uniref:tetratricopeptide repeat protein n=1 Tax=Acidimangrovimonas sediminis TaxID=2056283 RepID=UPI000C7F9F07|nr:tetratricopeptide repeat protein [Acidimangrovimonas sediminis]